MAIPMLDVAAAISGLMPFVTQTLDKNVTIFKHENWSKMAETDTTTVTLA